MNWFHVPYTAFSDHALAWQTLNQKTMNLAFFEPEFIDALLTHFFEGDECFVYAQQDNALTFAGFFKPMGKGQWMTCMPSQCPLGLMLHANPLSDETLKAICDTLPGTVAMLDLLQLDSKYTHFSPHNLVDKQAYITTGNRPIPDDFDAYFKSLGKNMRQNYNKVINRAARAEDTLSTRKVCDPNDVEAAILKYGEIESMGWKAQEGTAISPSNTQGKFYQQSLISLAKAGKACCWYYLINDEVVSVDLCIQQDDTLIILKTTYNEAFNKQSPALMLKIEMLKYYSDNLASEGIKNIEFYGKAMEWHKRLDSELREIEHATYFPNKILKSAIKLLKRVKK